MKTFQCDLKDQTGFKMYHGIMKYSNNQPLAPLCPFWPFKPFRPFSPDKIMRKIDTNEIAVELEPL
jgi:hypothetical protein